MNKWIASALFLLGAHAFGGPVLFQVSMSGPNESPSNSSTAIGSALITVDSTAHTLMLVGSFSGLSTPDTMAHIHCCTTTPLTGTAGVATVPPAFPGFPLGVTSGTFNISMDLTLSSSWNPTFVTNNGGTTASAEAAFEAGIAAREAYLNIHTNNFPGGEIRGFLLPAPEPGTLAFAGIGIAVVALFRRRAWAVK